MRARPVHKKQDLFVTRRVVGRVFRLKPGKRTNQIIRYILAVLVRRHNVSLHATCWMSNHHHDVLFDDDGRISAFIRDLHSTVARHINAVYGDFGSLWESEQTSLVRSEVPADVIGRIAYAMANPVEARLVRNGFSWPGVRDRWPTRPRTIKRPAGFFRKQKDGGHWPDEAVLEFKRPVGYDELDDDQLSALIESRIESAESRARETADAEEKRFLGRAGVLRQSRRGSPRTREQRFGISPRVASRDKWRRIEALQRDSEWYAAYCESRDRYCAGERSVVFPAGTYQLRILHRVSVAPPAD